MRIAVFGAGGTGGYLGALLARSGNQVSMIARGENLKAIQANGLKVESTKGDFIVHPAQVTSDPAEIGTVDTVIVAVKAWQVPEAAQAIVPLVGLDTAVVAFQNGVDAPSQLADVLGDEHVMIGLLVLRSFRIAPGCFRHTFDSNPIFRLGSSTTGPASVWKNWPAFSEPPVFRWRSHRTFGQGFGRSSAGLVTRRGYPRCHEAPWVCGDSNPNCGVWLKKRDWKRRPSRKPMG